MIVLRLEQVAGLFLIDLAVGNGQVSAASPGDWLRSDLSDRPRIGWQRRMSARRPGSSDFPMVRHTIVRCALTADQSGLALDPANSDERSLVGYI